MSPHRNAPKLTGRQVKEMRQHYLNGETFKTISVWYNVATSTVYHHTRDISRRRPRKIDSQKLREMVRAGYRQVDIARAFGVKQPSVSGALKAISKGGGHKLSKKDIKTLCRQYVEGARDVDLADWFCITEATVRYHTRDIRRVSPRRTFDHRQVISLRQEGLTFGAIGARLDASESSVRQAFWRYERRAAA